MEFTIFGQCPKKEQFLKSKIVLLRSLNIFGTKKIVFFSMLFEYFAVN